MRIILSIILVLTVTGCGTLANLQGKRHAFLSVGGQKPVRLYGGVRNDIDWVSKMVSNPDGFVVPVVGYFALIDPALSFVGDTVTLPVAIAVNSMHESPKESSADVENTTQPDLDRWSKE